MRYGRDPWLPPRAAWRDSGGTALILERALTAPAVVAFLLFDSALGGGYRLEPLVRDGLAALDREPVGAGCEPRLGPLDGGEGLTEVVREALVQLVCVEVRGLV